MLKYGCDREYMRTTSRPLHIRLKEHVNNIKRGDEFHKVSKHFEIHHNRDLSSLQFWGI